MNSKLNLVFIFLFTIFLAGCAYTPHKTNIISQRQRDVRLSAADLFLTHYVTFFEKQVLWSDEKYYVLNQGPNR